MRQDPTSTRPSTWARGGTVKRPRANIAHLHRALTSPSGHGTAVGASTSNAEGALIDTPRDRDTTSPPPPTIAEIAPWHSGDRYSHAHVGRSWLTHAAVRRTVMAPASPTEGLPDRPTPPPVCRQPVAGGVRLARSPVNLFEGRRSFVIIPVACLDEFSAPTGAGHRSHSGRVGVAPCAGFGSKQADAAGHRHRFQLGVGSQLGNHPLHVGPHRVTADE